MDLTAKHPSKSCKDEKLSFLDELGHFRKDGERTLKYLPTYQRC